MILYQDGNVSGRQICAAIKTVIGWSNLTNLLWVNKEALENQVLTFQVFTQTT